MRTLIRIAEDDKAPPSARVSAAGVILDRGWGKAQQSIDLDVRDRPASVCSDPSVQAAAVQHVEQMLAEHRKAAH